MDAGDVAGGIGGINHKSSPSGPEDVLNVGSMKNVFSVALFACLSGGLAQQTPVDTNPLDLTKFKDIAAASSLPTVTSVKNARANAEKLFDSEQCNADALAEWGKQANWLSNLMASGLEPFYSASSSDRKGVSGTTLDVLAPTPFRAW